MGKANQTSTKPSQAKKNPFGDHGGKQKSTKTQQKSTKTQQKSTKTQQSKSSIVLPSKMTTYTVPPPNWPSKLPYLSTSLISSSLTTSQQTTVHPSSLPSPTSELIMMPSLATFSPTCNPLVQIRSITDPAHPAYPQFGLFATKSILPGTYMIDYTGLLHSCPQPACATSDYDLAFLDRDASIAIDGSEMGNEGRFVNDYHGIRDQGPNAMFEEYYVKVKNTKGKADVWQARMGIWVAPVASQQAALRDSYKGIAKGEEICVSYGKGWWRARRSLMEDQNKETDEPDA